MLLLFLHQQKLFKVVFKPISRESWTLQERFLRYAKILWQKLFSILDQFQIWFSKKIPSKSSHPYHEYSLSWAIPITSIPYHEYSLSWAIPIMSIPYHERSLSWVFPIMSIPYHEPSLSWVFASEFFPLHFDSSCKQERIQGHSEISLTKTI